MTPKSFPKIRALILSTCFVAGLVSVIPQAYASESDKDDEAAVGGRDFCVLAEDGISCEAGTGEVDNIIDAYLDDRFCTLTAEAARFACFNDVEDDRWTANGNCLNTSDAQCFSDVVAEALEGNALCEEQFQARLEVCDALGEGAYDPAVDPAKFVDPEEIGDSVEPNPWLPLVPGTTWTYEGGNETNTVTVTEDTKEILGVTCAVVRDVVEQDGEVIEDTSDWYAQDQAGNVWYFGEIARNYEDGELHDLDGSWTAGVDGAKIGILMHADPMEGDVYRQEFALGEAEDMGEVLSLTGTASVPAADCSGDCLVTRDFTPVEPDADENKYYAPGIGLILEVDVATGARVELVEMSAP